MYLNKAFVIGNLTRDPEMKSLPSGIKVTTFSLATNRVWKNKDGAKQESVDFHNIVVFGRQAETSSQYLKKGSNALVEGRMQTRSWDAQDGTKKYRTEIVADSVQFGPRPGGFSAGSSSGNSSQSAGGPPANKAESLNKAENLDTIEYPQEEINPEDIPF
ncbi:MAG: single-strand binding protein, single-strand DNA-binding protein [Parcubacteria group bacterium]|nr:single-strand binding protein, single-strand DNA-binding protein [Parcubacteria group bacterium]